MRHGTVAAVGGGKWDAGPRIVCRVASHGAGGAANGDTLKQKDKATVNDGERKREREREREPPDRLAASRPCR